ncbi:MAG: bifunctional pyr operon transcriptional regulator/uracil phosphoribosyltransferase PyrR [Saprospiraceae bacterium]|nr:bifunctional pyr operon transcriptional regulator/uracil phosphoribosyltransferase PyrR [Saprospiraceae bacterium]
MKKKANVLFDAEQLHRTIDRLCYQIIERHEDFSNTCLIGIQSKGAVLSDRIQRRLMELNKKVPAFHGKLDITFFRDDFRKDNKILQAQETEIDFLIEDRRVILVDDVLYTGRTIQAGLQALSNFGRPASVELLVLIDRRFNRHLPIQANYTGLKVDAIHEAYVKVELKEVDGSDRVLFYDAELIVND